MPRDEPARLPPAQVDLPIASDDLNARFYEAGASAFFASSVAIDLSPIRKRFLRWVPAGGRVLDAGCGSGRDARAFHEASYDVEAFDASPALVALARAHTGLPVAVRRFEEVEDVDRFDGIWACASLLHVSPEALPDVFARLSRALVPGGALYASFKLGDGVTTRQVEGEAPRMFTDFSPEGLRSFVEAHRTLEIAELWLSPDSRPNREGELWTNAILRRPPAR